MKFHIVTLGCKVNLYESEIMKEKLLQNGYENTSLEEADLIIINTCSVTNMADKKSIKQVRHAKRLGKTLVVCGCSSENNRQLYETMGIDILLGNKDKSRIVEILDTYLQAKQPLTRFYDDDNYDFEDMAVDKFNCHTRAFVKIQDGCNNFCSYCIIPYIRKNTRNKSFAKALQEIETLVHNGHQEIVLTGIHTGSYHSAEGYDLADLIREMSKIDNLKRIRLSSVEVTELNPKLLKEIAVNDKVVNHFHIPLQSGSNTILKKMNRKYTCEEYREKIAYLRSIKKDVSITTDVIVGHPYETEKEFLETVQTCQDLGFAKIHVFPYSKRDKTVASTMPMQVEEAEKKRRSRLLNAVSKDLEIKYASQFLGQTMEVLIEEGDEQYSYGHTTNYLKVQIKEKLAKNTLVWVTLNSIDYPYITGNIKEKVKNY